MIRTRFAPSPTGYLHVGGLRTALYAYLFAKKNGGKFILRIEDTDRERFVEGGVENILNSLSWAGILPDEGVQLQNGNVVDSQIEPGPYTQSKRLDIYKKHAEELLKKGHAYYCFCSSERLEKLRDEQQKNKLPTGYDQFCLKTYSFDDALRKVSAGEKHVVRLNMPKVGDTEFIDLIREKVVFKNALIDDQVLIKSDGFPTYHLAVVVDDHLMGITHVIRGEEWISSTPKHLQLYKYFGWDCPEFAHLPLLLNSDKSKLSKRQGDVAVLDYKQKGYLPEALINFVAFLGWNPGDEREIFSLDDLIQEFDLKKVNKTGAVFNLEKLDWFNKEHLKKLSNEDILLKCEGFFSKEFNNEKLIGAISLERERVRTLSDLPEAVDFIFNLPEYKKEILIWKKSSNEELKKILPSLKDSLEKVPEKKWGRELVEKTITELIKTTGYSNGAVLWPLRVALSGKENSPGPFDIAAVLGREESLNRLNIALKKS